MTQKFIQDCDAWLNPLGFTCGISSADGSYRFYTSGDYKAGVECVRTLSETYCRVKGHANWQFLEVHTGKLQWQHPRIMDFIDAVDDLVRESADSHTRIHHRNILKGFKSNDKQ